MVLYSYEILALKNNNKISYFIVVILSKNKQKIRYSSSANNRELCFIIHLIYAQ